MSGSHCEKCIKYSNAIIFSCPLPMSQFKRVLLLFREHPFCDRKKYILRPNSSEFKFLLWNFIFGQPFRSGLQLKKLLVTISAFSVSVCILKSQWVCDMMTVWRDRMFFVCEKIFRNKSEFPSENKSSKMRATLDIRFILVIIEVPSCSCHHIGFLTKNSFCKRDYCFKRQTLSNYGEKQVFFSATPFFLYASFCLFFSTSLVQCVLF